MIIKAKCTNKYFIDDKRGWKLSFDIPDGDGYEANGQFSIIIKDQPAINKVVKDTNLDISI